MQQDTHEPVTAQQDDEAPAPPRPRPARRVPLPLAWASLLAIAFGVGSQLSFSVSPQTPAQSITRALQRAEFARLRSPPPYASPAVHLAQRAKSPDTLSEEEYAQQLIAQSKLLGEARQLMSDKAFDLARQKLIGCIDDQPASADCHKLLGTVYARQGESEQGASEYREFLRYAPLNHPDYDRVALILETFEQEVREDSRQQGRAYGQGME